MEICFPFSSAIGKIPVVGKKLRYLIPVSNYEGVYPLSAQQQREWSVLDTFDMLSPKYDQPQTAKILERWFSQAGLKDIEVFRHGVLVGRGGAQE